ncbi:enoyl-CoA hydratase/isomerase family protein [Novosphingobium sp. Gsoil 351]|uniref:enoyl-CoA hydratase/isomerase family protein n=1 Tax=Novosphingobium sp. Gsoil 351 TaxID=2675225 RepID=UPI0012B4BA00|nr:enoyl-CoA hydratase-related protein [Novosphingobium sp. Gsoil 351]QGN54454.1 enoyl-CoA hydratase/isomerase family protein [Novosphingobium sp. Gsoil 351]
MSVRLEREGVVAHLLIDRPDKRNAMTLAMWQAIPGLVEQAIADRAVRALVIRAAAPGPFCAGADLGEILDRKDDPAWLAESQAAINRTQRAVARATLPTIAFVEGDCIGGGCGLAVACDLRVATAEARFAVTPAKLGLVYPLHDVKLLVDLVGPGQAKRLMYSGSIIDADEALRIGLVETIAASPAGLLEPILEVSPFSIRETKGFVRRVLEGQAEDDDATWSTFAGAFAGSDFREGVGAFVARRKARFDR